MKKIEDTKQIIAGARKRALGIGNIGFFTISSIGSMLASTIANAANLAANDILKQKGIDPYKANFTWDSSFIRMGANAYSSSVIF